MVSIVYIYVLYTYHALMYRTVFLFLNYKYTLTIVRYYVKYTMSFHSV